jgi:hypothetical protein
LLVVSVSGAPAYREIKVNKNTTIVSEDLLPFPPGWKKKARDNEIKEEEGEKENGENK